MVPVTFLVRLAGGVFRIRLGSLRIDFTYLVGNNANRLLKLFNR